MTQAAAGQTEIVAEPGQQEVVVTRRFDAAPEQVFRAYVDPELIPLCWGPRELTTHIDRLEARSGGSWRFVQSGADGSEHAFHGVFHEVLAPSRIVATFEYEGVPGHVMLETVTFEVHQGGTLLTARDVFQSLADRDGMVAAGMSRGVIDSMDRIAELLAAGGVGDAPA